MKLVQDLPEIFEEFGEKRREAFLEVKEYKDKGVPVVGMYCAYFPTELAMAVGAIPVGLCSFSNETVTAAERELPKSMCPLVKSSYGFAIEDKCPFFHFADLVIGETTCDGKKKMYELMKEFKNVYIMELPNTQNEAALELWKKEIIRFKEYLEETFNTTITEEQVRHAVHVANQGRLALRRFYETMKNDPAPMEGSKLFNVLYGSQFKFDKEAMPAEIDALTEKIMKEYEEGEKPERRKRILLTGCPSSGAPMKVVKAIEENGGNVVVYENCGGAKSVDRLIDEEAEDIYQAIAERYLAIGCSVMTPDTNRYELLERLLDEYQVEGVVEMTLQACHTYNIEAKSIEKRVKEKGLPYIHIETDYSQADVGQLDTRIAAFLEMI